MRSTSLSWATAHRSIPSHLLLVLSLTITLCQILCASCLHAASCYMQRLVMLRCSPCMPSKGKMRTHTLCTFLSPQTNVCCHISFSTYHSPPITLHLSLSTHHSPPITVHLSLSTHHSPPITLHLSLSSCVKALLMSAICRTVQEYQVGSQELPEAAPDDACHFKPP